MSIPQAKFMQLLKAVQDPNSDIGRQIADSMMSNMMGGKGPGQVPRTNPTAPIPTGPPNMMGGPADLNRLLSQFQSLEAPALPSGVGNNQLSQSSALLSQAANLPPAKRGDLFGKNDALVGGVAMLLRLLGVTNDQDTAGFLGGYTQARSNTVEQGYQDNVNARQQKQQALLAEADALKGQAGLLREDAANQYSRDWDKYKMQWGAMQNALEMASRETIAGLRIDGTEINKNLAIISSASSPPLAKVQAGMVLNKAGYTFNLEDLMKPTVQQELAGANIGKVNAETGQINTLLPGKVDMQGANLANVNARTAGVNANTEQTLLENKGLRIKLDFLPTQLQTAIDKQLQDINRSKALIEDMWADNDRAERGLVLSTSDKARQFVLDSAKAHDYTNTIITKSSAAIGHLKATRDKLAEEKRKVDGQLVFAAKGKPELVPMLQAQQATLAGQITDINNQLKPVEAELFRAQKVTTNKTEGRLPGETASETLTRQYQTILAQIPANDPRREKARAMYERAMADLQKGVFGGSAGKTSGKKK